MTQTVPEWKTTADEIWAILKETARRQEESERRHAELDRQMKETARRQEETDRQMKETARRQEETDRQIKETGRQMKETDRQMKDYNKRFGEFTNRFGEVVEYMVVPNLLTKFNELNFNFDKATRSIKVKGHDVFSEIDAFLENGDKTMVVEIKTKPTIGDINDHIERMEKLRLYAGDHNDKRSYMGAIAGVVFNENVKTHALKNGFYVIEPSGESFNITEPTGEYRPREWLP